MNITLTKKWEIGQLIGSGGFAKVHEAKGEDGSEAVAKLIPKEPGADRELLFVSLSGHKNIIPILDSGEWKDYYVLVMPRAEKNLRQRLLESGNKLPVDASSPILRDIAEALRFISLMVNDVVHRDLKPENVLFYKDHWCLTDFGIARYASASTAPDTRKYSMTEAYAAPEQWRWDRVTYATDIYAFGIIAYELLHGQRPFLGPNFRDQHLNQRPEQLTECPSFLSGMINECLLKAQDARPTAANILERLKLGFVPPSPAGERLRAANNLIVQQQAEKDTAISAQRSLQDLRAELFQASKELLKPILTQLKNRAIENAPAIKATQVSDDFVLQLGDCVLQIDRLSQAPAECLAYADPAPFDVITYTEIMVKMPENYGYEGRSHSLWFCNAHEKGAYRWFELSFMANPWSRESFSMIPFALSPVDEGARQSFSNIMSVRQLAWKPRPIDQGQENQFIERWLDWFGSAVAGSFTRPSHMPDDTKGHFVRHVNDAVRK